mmetsp:Transcript_36896/g.97583  ORF Transcript_36896/g.97583 Transcript_36896/m.97583 type:complete len:414 (+) Transcript_36896:1501-2742(+)
MPVHRPRQRRRLVISPASSPWDSPVQALPPPSGLPQPSPPASPPYDIEQPGVSLPSAAPAVAALVLITLPAELLALVVAHVPRLAALALVCSKFKVLCRARRRAETEAGRRRIATPLGSAARVDWEIEVMGATPSELYKLAICADMGEPLARAAWHLARSESVVEDTLECDDAEQLDAETWLLALRQAVVRGEADAIVDLFDCDVARDASFEDTCECLTLAIHHGAPSTRAFVDAVAASMQYWAYSCVWPIHVMLDYLGVILQFARRPGPALEGEELMLMVLLYGALKGLLESPQLAAFDGRFLEQEESGYETDEQGNFYPSNFEHVAHRYPRLDFAIVYGGISHGDDDHAGVVEEHIVYLLKEEIVKCLAALRWRRVRRALQLWRVVRYWRLRGAQHAAALAAPHTEPRGAP